MVESAIVALDAAYSVLHHALRPAHRSPSPEDPEDRVCFCAYHTGISQGENARMGGPERTVMKESRRPCLVRYHGFRSVDTNPSYLERKSSR